MNEMGFREPLGREGRLIIQSPLLRASCGFLQGHSHVEFEVQFDT